MRNKLPLLALLAFSGVCSLEAQEAKPLTQEELLRQIESLTPPKPGAAKKPALQLAPAPVVTPSAPRTVPGEARILPDRVAVNNPLPAPAEEPKQKKAKGATEITALEATFDQKSHQAVFIGDVVVKDPEFNLQCDHLTAYLKHDDVPSANAAPAPATPAPKPDADGKKKSGGLEKAVAEGHVIITQDKVETDGSISKSTGRAQRADYSAVTGEMILSGSPEVTQGMNTCVATDPRTRLYMTRDGKMRADGPTKTTIRDQGDSK